MNYIVMDMNYIVKDTNVNELHCHGVMDTNVSTEDVTHNTINALIKLSYGFGACMSGITYG